MTETIEEQLRKLPGLIRDQQNMMLETAAKLADAEMTLEHAKHQLSNYVLNSSVGKEKYTNDAARKAAVAEYLADNATYQETLRKKISLEQIVALERIALEFLHNTFRATLTIAQMPNVISIERTI